MLDALFLNPQAVEQPDRSDLLSEMAGVGVGPPTPVEGHDLLACRRLLDGLGIGEQVNRALRRVVAEAQLTSWPPPQ